MSKNWGDNLVYGISISTILTSLTIDHWYVSGAIMGILSTLIATVSNIYFSGKADQRAEEKFKEVMPEK